MKNITKNVIIDRVGSLVTDLGECPIWNPDTRHLWLMDCRKGLVVDMDPDSLRIVSREVPAPSGSYAFNEDGRIVIALKDHIGLMCWESGSLNIVAKIKATHKNIRFNDGVALSDGSFIVGTMHVDRDNDEEPMGGIYRVSSDGLLKFIAPGLGVANGPNVSEVDKRLYIADSTSRKVFSFSMKSNMLSDKQLFVDTNDFKSGPDGCKFDTDGGLWCAMVRSGSVVRFDREGKASHIIRLPLSHPASLCFGGENLDELYVTSIRNSGRLKADGPLDGAILRIRNVGYRGFLSHKCNIKC